MDDVISMTNFVTDMPAFMAAGDIRRSFLSPPYPVTTTVQVVSLYRRELMVEITASPRFRATGSERRQKWSNADHDTVSPWSARSRPSRSISSPTRKPIVQSITLRITKLTAPP
jgi:Endoribonuclease L-PSP